MRNEKLAAIHQYLSEHFPECAIEQKHDFDRDAETYKVHVEKGTLLLKVGGLFTDDNDIPEILRLFGLFALADVLKEERELGILVTNNGLEKFNRG